MSFIPEDRLGMGLAPNFSITDNMMLKTFKERKKFVVKEPKEGEEVNKFLLVLKKIWCGIKTVVWLPFVDRKKARREAKELIEKGELILIPTYGVDVYKKIIK
jgi:ABC-type uncharacterized transport system ATPase subunit